MEVAEFLAPEGVITGLRPRDKPQLLDELARRAAARLGLETQVVLDALVARERLGSTGVGHGIAIPHARIDGIERLFGLFAHLERPIDFEAIDEQPVDLVFLLLTPSGAGNEHLAALAAVSRRLRDKEVRRQLRGQKDALESYEHLAGIAPGRGQ